MEALPSRTRLIRTAAILSIGAVALAGCSGGSGGDADGDAADKLTVWFPGTNQAEIDLVTKTIVPAFEKETGVEVEVTYLDWSDLSTKLNAAFPAGTAPDVFGHGPAAIADFVVNDRIEDLDPYLDELDTADVEDFAAALPGGQVDGVQYLIPLSMQGNLFIYDAEDFRDAGLDPDAPPTTWEGILDASEKLTVRDGSGKITRSGLLLPSQAVGRQQTFANLLLAAGGDQIEDGKAAFNTDAGEEALSFFVDTYAGDDAVATNLGENYMDAPAAQQPIVTDAASITMTVAPRAAQIAEAAPDLDLRVLPVPSFESADPGALGGSGAGLMINKDSQAKDLAWKFISYMLSPEISEQYTEGIGAVPTRMSALDSDYVQGSKIVQAWLEAGPSFTPNPNVAGWVQARDTMDVYLEQALHEKLSVKDALAQMEDAVNKVLEASAG
ncbi:ABC transporter substrate-binding protein [Microbacterium sp. NPDC058342]|uniref:ABC transporter substrate-binding protein n=1 Tax=Microbacterium sp. NPDC058342 TaxID=3346454 RepID=UPI0036566E54